MSEGVDEIKDKDWIRAWSTRVGRGEPVKGAAGKLTMGPPALFGEGTTGGWCIGATCAA